MNALPHVALIGKAGSGKSTAATLLQKSLGYERLSFAGTHEGGLRDVIRRIWGEKAINDRSKLIAVGMAIREIDEDAWVNAALRAAASLQGRVTSMDAPIRQMITYEPVPLICDDCRLPNEARALKAADFIIIRIVAGRATRIDRLTRTNKLGDEGWEEHISETALDNWPHDYRVVNEATTTKAELHDDLIRCIKLDRQVVGA